MRIHVTVRSHATVVVAALLFHVECLTAQTTAPFDRPAGLHAASALTSSDALAAPAPPARILEPVAIDDPPPAPIARFLAPVVMDPRPTAPEPRKIPTADDEFGLNLPAKDRLFRLESESAWLDRLARELPKVKNVQFPKDAPIAAATRTIEAFPQSVVGPVLDPVCYRPLYFEDKRAERFGQYIPCLQPLVSASRFYVDVLKLPCRVIAAPPWSYECDNR